MKYSFPTFTNIAAERSLCKTCKSQETNDNNVLKTTPYDGLERMHTYCLHSKSERALQWRHSALHHWKCPLLKSNSIYRLLEAYRVSVSKDCTIGRMTPVCSICNDGHGMVGILLDAIICWIQPFSEARVDLVQDSSLPVR